LFQENPNGRYSQSIGDVYDRFSFRSSSQNGLEKHERNVNKEFYLLFHDYVQNRESETLIKAISEFIKHLEMPVIHCSFLFVKFSIQEGKDVLKYVIESIANEENFLGNVDSVKENQRDDGLIIHHLNKKKENIQLLKEMLFRSKILDFKIIKDALPIVPEIEERLEAAICLREIQNQPGHLINKAEKEVIKTAIDDVVIQRYFEDDDNLIQKVSNNILFYSRVFVYAFLFSRFQLLNRFCRFYQKIMTNRS
jgi:hypothetical protein